MKYYKISIGSDFVGVATSLDFRNYQHKHHIIIAANEKTVKYIQYDEKLYHDKWMMPLVDGDVKCEMATVDEIDKELFDALFEAKEVEVVLEAAKPVVEEIEEPNEDFEYIQEMKIKEMSMLCELSISDGIDVELSDGIHHFSYTQNDQLNLNALFIRVQNGEQSLPYHGDGEDYKTYSADDIKKLYMSMENFKISQLTYFNNLRRYIQSLTTIQEVRDVEYGMDIGD